MVAEGQRGGVGRRRGKSTVVDYNIGGVVVRQPGKAKRQNIASRDRLWETAQLRIAKRRVETEAIKREMIKQVIESCKQPTICRGGGSRMIDVSSGLDESTTHWILGRLKLSVYSFCRSESSD